MKNNGKLRKRYLIRNIEDGDCEMEFKTRRVANAYMDSLGNGDGYYFIDEFDIREDGNFVFKF